MKIWPIWTLLSHVSDAVKAAKMPCYSFTKESLRLPKKRFNARMERMANNGLFYGLGSNILVLSKKQTLIYGTGIAVGKNILR